MLNLSNLLFENNLFIIQETLIDGLLNYIDLNMVNSELGSVELLKLKQELNNKFDVQINYRLHDDPTIKLVYGKYIRPNTIVLYFPVIESDRQKVTDWNIVNVFLHEFSHMLTDSKIPDLVYIKRLGEDKYTKLIKPPLDRINFEDDESKIKSLLDYVFQVRELPNFALTFALELVNSNKSTKEIFDNNFQIIKEYNTLNRNRYYIGLSSILQQLFQVQFFAYKVKTKYYIQKLIHLRNLIEKYRRRLLKYKGDLK